MKNSNYIIFYDYAKLGMNSPTDIFSKGANHGRDH